MEISSSINKQWRSITFASFIFCIIFIYFIHQNRQSSNLFSSKSTVLTFTVEQEAPKFITAVSNFTDKPIFPASKTLEQRRINQNDITTTTLPQCLKSSGKLPGKGESDVRSLKCDINVGKWIYKPRIKSSYNHSNCPFLEEKMNCRSNGRPDFEYENWVWQPKDCDFIQFNGTDMLERLRGKRMIMVGDSMNRNQWESLACLLYSSVDPAQVEGVQLKSKNSKIFRAKEYDFTLEFDFSPFLVQLDVNHESGHKVLKLDEISASADSWAGADIMLFNTGHWWVHLGKYKTWDLFEHKRELMEDMKIEVAFGLAMRTWSRWIDQNVDQNKTSVLFRSISPEHHGDFWCYNVTRPIIDDSYASLFPKFLSTIVRDTINRTRTPVRYLNITNLSQPRRDAHPGLYRSSRWNVILERYKSRVSSFVDCSHWCLPGVPDTWNRLLYSLMFSS